MSGGSAGLPDRREAAASVTVYPDGPLIVRGDFELLGSDGTLVATDRATVALCRCGRSRLKPLCDGSHRASKFADPAGVDEMAEVLRTARPPSGRKTP